MRKNINVHLYDRSAVLIVIRGLPPEKLFKIRRPEQVSLTRKRNLLVMYNKTTIPKSDQEQLSKFAETIEATPEIMSREYNKPDNKNMYVVPIPDDYDVIIRG